MAKKPTQDEIKAKKREFYSLTLVTVPTILMAIASQYIGNFFVRSISQIIIFFFQAIIVKGMLENKN